MIRTIRYGKHHRSSIIKLRNDPPEKEVLWDWEFEESSRISGRDFDPVLLADDDRIVGFNGVIPAKIKYESEVIEALWSCDFFVAPDYRGKGLGKRVKTELIRKAPVIMSFGVSPQASIVLTKMGWSKAEVPSFRRIVNKSRMPFVRKVKQSFLRLFQLFNQVIYSFTPRSDLSIELSSGLPEEAHVSALLDQVLSSYEKTVLRSFSYLSWKYERHPLARYEFLIAKEADMKLVGLMVVRRTGGVVKIVDYLGPKSGIEVKRSMVHYCCQSYPDATQFSMTVLDAEFATALKAEGFYRTRSGMAFFVRSSMGDPNPESGWFVIGGDSDGELLAASRESVVGLEGEAENG